MPLCRGGPNTRTLPTVLFTPSASKAADMAHLCVPQNQALGVCRGFVPDIQICGTHGRKDLVNATIISNAEEEEDLFKINLAWGSRNQQLWQHTEFHPNQLGKWTQKFFYFSYKYDLEWKSRSFKQISKCRSISNCFYHHIKSERNWSVNVWVQAHVSVVVFFYYYYLKKWNHISRVLFLLHPEWMR